MSDFVVSARKYRPQTFDTVVGQHSITNTLKNAIKSGHLAQAFLFCGSRGVGKTTTILLNVIQSMEKPFGESTRAIVLVQNKEKVLEAGIGKVANELNGWRKKKKLELKGVSPELVKEWFS